jgi:hypothetical protein
MERFTSDPKHFSKDHPYLQQLRYQNFNQLATEQNERMGEDYDMNNGGMSGREKRQYARERAALLLERVKSFGRMPMFEEDPPRKFSNYRMTTGFE